MTNNQNLLKKNMLHRVAFFALIFTLAFLLTACTPLLADDFNYAFSWADESRIDNFRLVISSMRAHRAWTHGRVFAQGLVTIFMMWPRWVFPIFNALIVTLFFWETERYFRFRLISRPVLASAVVGVLIWICMPVFGQIVLWLDGSCNYFWGAALGWTLIVEVMMLDQHRHPSIVMLLLVLPAFVVGAWSEHISFAVLMMLFLLILRSWIREKRFPAREAGLLLSGILGYLFLMLAPPMLPSALKKRAAYAAGEHVSAFLEMLKEYWWVLLIVLLIGLLLFLWLRRKTIRERLTALTDLALAAVLAAAAFFAVRVVRDEGAFSLVSSTPVGFLSLLACFLLGLRMAFARKVASAIILDAVMLCLSGMGALLLFLFAMYVPARGFCAPVVFMGLSTGLLWCSAKPEKPKLILSLLFAVFAVCFVIGCSDIWSLHMQAEKREEAIREALRTDGVLVAQPYSVRTKYAALYGLQDLAPGEDWPNDYIKDYYGLKEIRVVSEG